LKYITDCISPDLDTKSAKVSAVPAPCWVVLGRA